MIDPANVIRETWGRVVRERYPDGVHGRLPGADLARTGRRDRNAGRISAADIAGNIHQLLARPLPGKRTVAEPMLVWSSEGTTTQALPDGRESRVETFRLDFRAADARDLAEAYRGEMTSPHAETWEYQPDDYGLDVLLDRETLERFTERRVAVLLFRLR